jgi:regulator of sigma E protease
MNFLYTILAFGIVLGIIVLVHEFGHYIAARLMGVRVEVFSFGFGKRLLGKQVGETDFRLSLIPLGGYVKMAGEEEYDPDNLKPYEFHAKNRGQKIFILIMGPLMNLVLAFLIFTVINIAGVEIEKYKLEPPRLGCVLEDSTGEKAGLQPGDLILSIDGREIPTWKDLDLFIGANPNEVLPVVYERNGKRHKTSLEIKSATRYNMGDAGIYYDLKPKIGTIEEDFPAYKAGLKEGDIFLAINGKPVNYFDFADEISENALKPLIFKVKRGDETLNLEITPRKAYYLESEVLNSEEEASRKKETVKKQFPGLKFDVLKKTETYQVISEDIYEEAKAQKYKETGVLQLEEKGMIGIGRWIPYSPTIRKSYGLVEAMVKSKDDIVNLTFFIFRAFKKMIVGKISAKQLSGPIEIAKFSQKAMEQGPSNLFMLIAFISLQLGIINLLPIPALDGGHLMIFSIEAIIRKDFSPRVKNILLNLGFFLLIALMVFVVLNDVAKILPNGWDSFWPF